MNHLTVLYAEDDENDAFFMRRAIRKLNAPVTLQIAVNGRDAVDYLSGHGAYADRAAHPLPTLVLLDVKMPEMSGLEVLAWIRDRPGFAGMPVFMFTSSAQESDIAFSRTRGANAYLVKPSNSNNLHLLLEKILAVTAGGLPPGGPLLPEENLLC